MDLNHKTQPSKTVVSLKKEKFGWIGLVKKYKKIVCLAVVAIQAVIFLVISKFVVFNRAILTFVS